jgi:uncharacterized protein YdcH (DUF465 family)
MERRDEELIQQLMNHDDELRALYAEHVELKHQLESFRDKIHLSTEEELEKRRIQKLKLASKDKLMEILHRHVDHHEAH